MASFDVYNENNADEICNYSPQWFMLWYFSTRESDPLLLGEHIHWNAHKTFNYATNMRCEDVNGLVQDCSNSIANALELLQSCTKPSMCYQTILLVFLVLYCITWTFIYHWKWRQWQQNQMDLTTWAIKVSEMRNILLSFGGGKTVL